MQAGPFAGLNYVERSRGSAYWPKVLGTYELEIHAAVERAIARRPARVLVAGAAEGYYAVGLASRLPESEVVAWEPDSEARNLLRQLAERNGVERRVRIEGLCDLSTLAHECGAGERTLLVVDVDGGEALLLDPHFVPGLAQADMLVETHDCFVPTVTSTLVERFLGSHEVQRFAQSVRSAALVRELDVPNAWRGALTQLLEERRPSANEWLWLEAKIRQRADEVRA